MSRVMASGVRGTLTRTAVAAAVAGVALTGAAVTAHVTPAGAGPTVSLAQGDAGCDMFGWRHPMCGGGAWMDPVADDGIPGDNAAEGGIPAPASVPNVDGSLSPPGMPGDV